ncbi:MAG TPA: hypothetical protein VK464_07380 [Symbiobacteriaceae bacterium]|nr:hypothetical protein [Symbiobacteriaceae bacterium]
MQKVYILRPNEEDGILLDAMLAQGIEPDESEFCNPECPVCGGNTLLAYVADDGYEVVIWYELDEKHAAGAREWYLVCSDLECDWEEQVERVTDPMGATLFDTHLSNSCFEEECDLCGGSPARLKEVIAYLKELQQEHSTRKLQAFVEEAAWYCKDAIRRIRKWLQRVPAGRKVEITVTDGDQVKGTFVAATDKGCLLMLASGELVNVEAQAIYSYYPRRFDQWGPDEQEVDQDIAAVLSGAGGPDRLITGGSFRQRVVVRGFELEFEHVDRFGQYHVHTRDQRAGEALGLTQKYEGYWKGCFRRSDIAMRYDVNNMVKVKGYWVKVTGYTNTNRLPAVRTQDPEAAQALGLRPWKPIVYEEEGEPDLDRKTPRWTGVVPRSLVEEEAEVKSWYWPLPELHTAEGEGKR